MMRARSRPAAVLALIALMPLLAAGCAMGASVASPAATAAPIIVGAAFPTSGNASGLAGQELAGVQIALDMVNAAGGVNGRPVQLVTRDLESDADAPTVMAQLKAAGASVVLGAYSSALSISASSAASDEGLVYWEAGAVADQLTGRGLPLVFRVGASGSNLGSNSATFAATQLAPRLGKPANQLRVAIVAARDDYASSVAGAARSTAQAAGMPIVADETYDMYTPDWAPVMAALSAAQPDVIMLASHIPDGVAFRQAMVAAGVHTGALIGTTMAECDPDFASDLGPDAIGVFASDRPTGGFQPSALSVDALAVYDQFATAWAARGQPTNSTENTGEGSYGYEITGPSPAGGGNQPTEEGISGFSAAWALFHYVLPAAASSADLTPLSIAAAARTLDLPEGSLPNGAGIHFSSDPQTLGQNERAVGVVWQWQAVRTYTFVWPPTYATGSIAFVPLAR
jgi:branched-chain amino acid transport system substrate-binding protein